MKLIKESGYIDFEISLSTKNVKDLTEELYEYLVFDCGLVLIAKNDFPLPYDASFSIKNSDVIFEGNADFNLGKCTTTIPCAVVNDYVTFKLNIKPDEEHTKKLNDLGWFISNLEY